MDAIKSLVQPLVMGTGGSSGVIDGMRLVVLGGTVETARRVSSSAWNHFVNCESLLHTFLPFSGFSFVSCWVSPLLYA
jgi:hypothetical protein